MTEPIVQNLSTYDQSWFHRGKSLPVIVFWQLIQATLFRWSPHFANAFRALLLRIFGARIGKEVIIRPSVRITYPWRLEIADYVWIGEEVYLHTLGDIHIASHAVVSQRAFLCTGSHAITDENFGLIVKPIRVESEVWVAAQCFIGPGITLGAGSVVSAGSVVLKDVAPLTVVGGNPCQVIGSRNSKAR